ncbi:MAG TPA: hypothetical protein VNU26_02595, partial [Mycobacteriales bacterium]|nr:hypothetical protein [Mycobacteriales bacterium]
ISSVRLGMAHDHRTDRELDAALNGRRPDLDGEAFELVMSVAARHLDAQQIAGRLQAATHR